MSELLKYLRTHRRSLNLAEISRKAGLDDSYVKKAVLGNIEMSEAATERVSDVLRGMVSDFPEAVK